MKRIAILILCVLGFGGSVVAQDRLWYDHPATCWLEALPLGNSRMGAMVFGGTGVEQIQLNEETFWSGGPHNNNSTTSLQHLDEVRSLIFDKGPHGMRFLTVGSLMLDFGHTDVSGYNRELDLNTALSTTSYRSGGVGYVRRALASLPDGIVAIHVKADRKKALNFTISHQCQFPLEVKAETNVKAKSLRQEASSGSSPVPVFR